MSRAKRTKSTPRDEFEEDSASRLPFMEDAKSSDGGNEEVGNSRSREARIFASPARSFESSPRAGTTPRGNSSEDSDEDDSDYDGGDDEGTESNFVMRTPNQRRVLTRSQVHDELDAVLNNENTSFSIFEELDVELNEDETFSNDDDDDDDDVETPFEKMLDGNELDFGSSDSEEQDEDEADEAGEWKADAENEESANEDEILEEAELIVSDSEVEALRSGAPTFMQPEDIRRIRKALREHVQLLTEVTLMAASAKSLRTMEMGVGLLDQIVQLGRKANLQESIMKKANPEAIANVLERFRIENTRENPPHDQPPGRKNPIWPRLERIMNDFGPTLNFSKDLYPDIKRQKIKPSRAGGGGGAAASEGEAAPGATPDSTRKAKVWRNWSDEEITLVVMGFERYGGNARAVTQKIHEYLLPVRESHIITRIVNEATGKNKGEDKFEPIRMWLQQYPTSRLSPEEERRLLHGVAEQQVKTIDRVDFDRVSKSLLPHISGFMLRKRFEDIIVRLKKEAAGASSSAAQAQCTEILAEESD